MPARTSGSRANAVRKLNCIDYLHRCHVDAVARSPIGWPRRITRSGWEMFTTRARCWVVFTLLVQPLLLSAQTVEQVHAGFVTPPDDARVMMRWWWFGPAVSEPELKREIAAMKAGGYGGFEIQPVYPLSLDDAAIRLRNLSYLSDEFIDAVRFAAKEGVEQGLRVDITLGSGWPF